MIGVAAAAQFPSRNLTRNLILELKWTEKANISDYINNNLQTCTQCAQNREFFFSFVRIAGVEITVLPCNHRVSDGKQEQVTNFKDRAISKTMFYS